MTSLRRAALALLCLLGILAQPVQAQTLDALIEVTLGGVDE